MKYRQLTKEQLEALTDEFSIFLATQQIDRKEWLEINKSKPEIAQEELAIFSDLVWEDVLSKVGYIEHVSEKDINLFYGDIDEIKRIYVKCSNESFNLLNENDFKWFLENPLDDSFLYYSASKKYNGDRNLELFKLIEMGGEITEGELFKEISKLIP
ncbi:DUF6495 family protein [Lutibacter sp.]|uniref:DUF6495 family protein n=1 Tax=Lutibacter sp. TaxID=1925666 RepID=UPI002732702B|nr:DUF6495 family protein [Lutibacter sp.]MDP3312627.1 DUF6495 family protein [Lutibacter sp.]